MEEPSEKEFIEKAYLAEKYMAKDQESTTEEKTSKKEFTQEFTQENKKENKKESKKEVTNEEIMEKLNTLEYLIIEINQAQIQMKKDTTKMSEHINTVDTIMSKMPLNLLGGFSFKTLKP